MRPLNRIPARGAFFALSLITACFASSSQAGEETSSKAVTTTAEADSIWTRDTLTGDWGGLRTDLSKRGIDIDLRLSQYYQGVASGGVATGSDYGGTMDYRVNLDIDKLLGVAKGLSFNVHARTRYGRDINSKAGALALPNGGMLMPAPGDYSGTDITGATGVYMFPFINEREMVIQLGMLDAIDMVTGFFPNIDYAQGGFWNVNALSSNMPWFGAVQGLSLWGGMVVTIHPKYKMAESGFLFTGTNDNATDWKSVHDAYEDGVWLAAFHRFFWEVDDNMGYFMVFGAGSTKEQASNDPHSFINIPGQGIVNTDERNPWDIALYLYQDIWKSKSNPNRKANIFLGTSFGPDNPQFAQYNLFGNIEMFGPFASRPLDRVGFVGWWNGLSSNFKELVASSSDTRLRDTWGMEMYYSYAITPWAHLSADLQLVQNENHGDDFAIIPGVRMVIDF